MRKLLNNRWFVTTLALAAIALVWSSLQPAITYRVGTAAPAGDELALAGTDTPPAGSESLQPSMRQALQQLSLQKNLRDPFALRPLAEAPQSEKPGGPDVLDKVHLSALWTQNGATLVLINERIQAVGDSFGPFTLDSASREGVWLTHWKGRTFLEVGQNFILKTPARLSAKVSSP